MADQKITDLTALSSFNTTDVVPVVDVPNSATKKATISQFDNRYRIALNVKDYGAKGDGSTDDTTAIRNAITDAGSQGEVHFPAGTYITQKLTLPTGVWLIGAGYEATILQLKNGVNDNLIETTNFSSLTGTDTATATPYNFGISHMTLDGNKSNQSAGNGVALYGYGYTLNNIRIRNCFAWGLWQEWGTSSAAPTSGDSMEAFVTNFKIHNCTSGGIRFKGPHDTQFVNGIVYNNGNGAGTYGIYIPTDQFGSGSIFSDIHVWGGNYDYGFNIVCTGISLFNCQIEGALLAEVRIAANSVNVIGCKIFSLESNTVTNVVKGILFANSAIECFVSAKMENMGGGAVDFTSSGGSHFIEIFSDYYQAAMTVPSPQIVGSVDSKSTFIFHAQNASHAAVSDATFTWPGAIKNQVFQASYSSPGGIGVNTPTNATIAAVINTGADNAKGVVIFPNSSSQSVNLLEVQNASFAAVFSVDKNGNTTIGDGANIILGTSTGTKIGTATSQKLGFFNASPVIQQTQGATLTNNVASGGSANTLANFTSLSTYSSDAAAIRNNIYQLGQTLKTVVDALRSYGLLS